MHAPTALSTYTQRALFRHKQGAITIDVCGRFEKRPYRDSCADASADAGVDAGGYVSRGSGG